MEPPAISSRPAQQTEPLAIVAFVLSLCGWFGFAFLGWIPAIVCGHIARSRIRVAANLQGDGFALASLVISYIGLAFMVLAIIVFFGFFLVSMRSQATTHMQIVLPQHP